MNSFFACLAALLFLAAIVVAITATYFILRELRRSRYVPNPDKPAVADALHPPASSINPTSPSAVATKHETVAVPRSTKKTEPTPNAKLYRRAQLSRAEGHFYDFLKLTIGDAYIVNTKTPLRELFKPYGYLEKELYTMWANGHADFVLLEPTIKTPILAIELDGTTHNDPAQIKRDQCKDELFQRASMRLLRFRTGVLWGEKERAEILAALPKQIGS